MGSSHTVFVTGASGFIAKHVLVRVLNTGHSVIGSVRSLRVAKRFAPQLPPIDGGQGGAGAVAICGTGHDIGCGLGHRRRGPMC